MPSVQVLSECRREISVAVADLGLAREREHVTAVRRRIVDALQQEPLSSKHLGPARNHMASESDSPSHT